MSASPRRLLRVLGLFDVSILASAAMGPAYSLASTMGFMVVAANTAAPLALAALVAIMLCLRFALAAVIGINVVQSDATTRYVDVAGIVLGLPFALWRRRGTAATAAMSA